MFGRVFGAVRPQMLLMLAVLMILALAYGCASSASPPTAGPTVGTERKPGPPRPGETRGVLVNKNPPTTAH